MAKIVKMISIDEVLYQKAKEYDKNFSRAVHDGLTYFLTAKLQAAEKMQEIARLQEQIENLKAISKVELSKNELNAWIDSQPNAITLRGRIYEVAQHEKRNWDDIAREYQEGKRVV